MDNNDNITDKEQQRLEELALRRLPIWSWYIKGARTMLLRLREHLLTDEPKKVKASKDDKIYNKAILDMILSDRTRVDLFLQGCHDICFRNHVRDKKGKLVSCEAYFAKKTVKYEEI